jgi:hypothetical protein
MIRPKRQENENAETDAIRDQSWKILNSDLSDDEANKIIEENNKKLIAFGLHSGKICVGRNNKFLVLV